MSENIEKLIKIEEKCQNESLNLIASENYPSKAVRAASGSILTSKYAEGYPGARYYGGCENYDKIENLAIESAKKIFKAEHANVQPHSGTSANFAVYLSVCQKGDTILAPQLHSGGHLSHGAKINFSGQYFNIKTYQVDPQTGIFDYKEIQKLASKIKPKMIICGFTSYPRQVEFGRFAKIAEKVDAYLLADIAHIAGLVVTSLHPKPLEADFITTTTHKTLRGPRGGIILCKKKYAKLVDRVIFPGIQGGPLMNTIAAKALALQEAQTPEFRQYQQQVVKNAKKLAIELQKLRFKLLTDGTDTHLIIVDLRNKGISGRQAEEILEKVGIFVNRQVIPCDPLPPREASGMRIGTPAITTRGAKEKEMIGIAHIIADVINNPNQKVLKESKVKIRKIAKSLNKV